MTFLFRFVSLLNRIKDKDMIVICFTYAMDTLGKEERMSVKKTSKQQRGDRKFFSEI